MGTLDGHGRIHSTTVIDRRQLATDVVLMTLDAPQLARATRAGQYLMAIPPSAQSAATALAIYGTEGNHASILFFLTGRRTRELATLNAGSRLDVLGPLGNGFDCSRDVKDVAIAAGGVGIASVLLCARTLISAGARVRLFYGARTRELLVDVARFADAGCEMILSTNDGSCGERGLVTETLARSSKPQIIYACGPSPMLREVARIAEEGKVPAQLALEETFGCGVGGCWGCVVPVIAQSAQAPSFPPPELGGSDVVYARICKEGPVFWSDELRW